MRKENNKTKWGIIIGLIILVGIVGIGIFLVKESYNNTEIELRKKIEAEQVIYEQNFDKMYKVIAQTAEVAERNVEANREAIQAIYPELIEGRYSQGDGTLMKWIQENNPTWDMQAITDTYNKVIIAVEAQREELFTQAKKLQDLVRERESFIEKWPGRWFIRNQEKIKITLVSSKHTKEVFKTGEDNEIDLFKKNKED